MAKPGLVTASWKGTWGLRACQEWLTEPVLHVGCGGSGGGFLEPRSTCGNPGVFPNPPRVQPGIYLRSSQEDRVGHCLLNQLALPWNSPSRNLEKNSNFQILSDRHYINIQLLLFGFRRYFIFKWIEIYSLIQILYLFCLHLVMNILFYSF